MQNSHQPQPSSARQTPTSGPGGMLLSLEEAREFVDLLERGLSAAQRLEQDTPAQQRFVGEISRRGAELTADLLSRPEHAGRQLPRAGRYVQALQLADTYLYPQMELLAHPEQASSTDLQLLLSRHVGQLSAPTPENRPHRVAAARAVIAVLATVLEASPAGFELDAAAEQEIRAMTDAFDVLFPAGV